MPRVDGVAKVFVSGVQSEAIYVETDMSNWSQLALTSSQLEQMISRRNVVAPGGTLVYAVCSLQPEEGEAQIEALLAATPELARKPVTEKEVPGLAGLTPAAITREGDIRTLPCHFADAGGIDGFFIARLQRH